MKAFLLLLLSAVCSYGQFVKVDNKSFIQDGKRFYSIGINAVKIYDGPGMVEGDPVYDQRQQGEAFFIKEIKRRFQAWGFNTIGPFSSGFLQKDFRYCHCIYFGNYYKGASHMLADVFSEDYVKIIDEYAKIECENRKNDKNLIGYFISNELKIFGNLPWKPHQNSLLDIYLRLPEGSPGKIKAFEFSEQNKLLEYNKKRDLWASIVMEEYMRICTQAIYRYDPNHLILGTRFAGIPPDEVVIAVAKYSDVLSFNLYNHDFSLTDRWYLLTNKPIMITEFSWRAVENLSGNKNIHGPDVTVNTDKDRANNYREYLKKIINRSYIIGIQWFQYYDEPKLGRNDGYGEDGAYGIVSILNEPYEALTSMMSIMNKKWQKQLAK